MAVVSHRVWRVRAMGVSLLALQALCAPAAVANIFTLDFEGLRDLEAIEEFYNGGFGSLGSGPGPSFGVEFVGNTLAVVDADAGGTGNFANEITPSTVMFFLSGSATIMNIRAGFENAFSLYYSSIDAEAAFSIFDGLNGEGNLLATEFLTPLGTEPDAGDPNGEFNRWSLKGTAFAGMARSVVFSGEANRIVFDNVVFGDIPAPGGVAAGALVAMAAGLRPRRRA
ncbi:MAG: PEP-CTERM sorting domain-containing protein [Planctomycetota bacterium]|nr:PEP-CTERM sorting domain-containing protein [Planctomycetota bacterium]